MFYRLAVELGRLEQITHHRLNRGIFENGLSAHKFRIVWLAIFSYRNQHDGRASDATGLGDGWVNEWASPKHLERLKLRLLDRSR